MTNQRLVILNHLKDVKTHPTAEMVYDSVIEKLPQITLATVYRNLNLLARENKILKFTVNDINRFDGDISNHQHCVCKTCGKIIDLFQEKITNFAIDTINTNKFNAQSVSIIYYGYCTNCKKK